MESITKINDSIHRLTLPYKDIFTTVYTVETDEGILVFDSGSFDDDTEKYILPFFDKIGLKKDLIKYVFISHHHKDHSGGLNGFTADFTDVTILTKSPELKEEFSNCKVILHGEGDTFLDVLKVVTIPGHTQDSCGILDTRTNTLISGDCLQLHGIIGSGNWASNISFPSAHIEAINKLRKMKIDSIYTAHDYYPYGYKYLGETAVANALDACLEPLEKIKNLILHNSDLTDEEICNIFNSESKPHLGSHVVTAIREIVNQGEQT